MLRRRKKSREFLCSKARSREEAALRSQPRWAEAAVVQRSGGPDTRTGFRRPPEGLYIDPQASAQLGSSKVQILRLPK